MYDECIEMLISQVYRQYTVVKTFECMLKTKTNKQYMSSV